jgi:hypothetical protein
MVADFPGGEKRDVALALVVSLRVKMINKIDRNEASPNSTSFDKHSSFVARTHFSAYEFRFGLRAGSGIGFMPPAANVVRNCEQNFVSRSCNAYLR